MHEMLIDSHTRFTRRLRIPSVNTGDDRERVVMLRHVGRGHCKQNAIRIDESNLLALANKGDRRALDDADADAIRQKTHDGGALNPGDLLELFTAITETYEKDVSANIPTEDRKHVGTGDLGE